MDSQTNTNTRYHSCIYVMASIYNVHGKLWSNKDPLEANQTALNNRGDGKVRSWAYRNCPCLIYGCSEPAIMNETSV